MPPGNETNSSIPSEGKLLTRVSDADVRKLTSITSVQDASLAATDFAHAVRQGIQDAIANQDVLIGYSELARRLNLKEKFVRQLKNAGIIPAAVDLKKVVRFHWPSVLNALRRNRPRDGLGF